MAKYQKEGNGWRLKSVVELEIHVVEESSLKIVGEVAFDCTHEFLIQINKDLWLDKQKRDNIVENGIGNTNLRKLLCGYDVVWKWVTWAKSPTL